MRDLMQTRRALAKKSVNVSQTQLAAGLIPPEDRPQKTFSFQFPKPGFFLLSNPVKSQTKKSKSKKKGKSKKSKKKA